jgi:hypothetical protein
LTPYENEDGDPDAESKNDIRRVVDLVFQKDYLDKKGGKETASSPKL